MSHPVVAAGPILTIHGEATVRRPRHVKEGRLSTCRCGHMPMIVGMLSAPASAPACTPPRRPKNGCARATVVASRALRAPARRRVDPRRRFSRVACSSRRCRGCRDRQTGGGPETHPAWSQIGCRDFGTSPGGRHRQDCAAACRHDQRPYTHRAPARLAVAERARRAQAISVNLQTI